MLIITKHGVLLQKRNLDFESEGVLNPGVYQDTDKIVMLYRAVAEGNMSTIGYCEMISPIEVSVRMDAPIINKEFEYESHGVEDPRIVKIDNLYYITYCAYDGNNAYGAVATSTDLKTFTKLGVMVPQVKGDEFRSWLRVGNLINDKYYLFNLSNNFIWIKNNVLFPRKINNKFFYLLRIKPGIQIVSFNEFSELNEVFWKHFLINLACHIVIDPKFHHELSYIGTGCPPIETAEGWLLIYHGVHDTITGFMYSACAALLDLEDPSIEIARLPYPIFEPQEEWETKGYVNNVCFPTGTVLIDDKLYIYYGAADERIGCASLSLKELLAELLLNKLIHNV